MTTLPLRLTAPRPWHNLWLAPDPIFSEQGSLCWSLWSPLPRLSTGHHPGRSTPNSSVCNTGATTSPQQDGSQARKNNGRVCNSVEHNRQNDTVMLNSTLVQGSLDVANFGTKAVRFTLISANIPHVTCKHSNKSEQLIVWYSYKIIRPRTVRDRLHLYLS